MFSASAFLSPLLMNSSHSGPWWGTHNVTFISLDPNHKLRKKYYSVFYSQTKMKWNKHIVLFHSSKWLGYPDPQIPGRHWDEGPAYPPAQVLSWVCPLLSTTAMPCVEMNPAMLFCSKDTCHLTEEQYDLNCSWRLDSFHKHSIFWKSGKKGNS